MTAPSTAGFIVRLIELPRKRPPGAAVPPVQDHPRVTGAHRGHVGSRPLSERLVHNSADQRIADPGLAFLFAASTSLVRFSGPRDTAE